MTNVAGEFPDFDTLSEKRVTPPPIESYFYDANNPKGKTQINEFPSEDGIRIFQGVSPEVSDHGGSFSSWMLEMDDMLPLMDEKMAGIHDEIRGEIATAGKKFMFDMDTLLSAHPMPGSSEKVHHDHVIDKLVALLTLVRGCPSFFESPADIAKFLEEHLESCRFTGKSKDYIRLSSARDIDNMVSHFIKKDVSRIESDIKKGIFKDTPLGRKFDEAMLEQKKKFIQAQAFKNFTIVEPNDYDAAIKAALRTRKAMNYVAKQIKKGFRSVELLEKFAIDLLNGEFPPKDFEDFS